MDHQSSPKGEYMRLISLGNKFEEFQRRIQWLQRKLKSGSTDSPKNTSHEIEIDFFDFWALTTFNTVKRVENLSGSDFKKMK